MSSLSARPRVFLRAAAVMGIGLLAIAGSACGARDPAAPTSAAPSQSPSDVLAPSAVGRSGDAEVRITAVDEARLLPIHSTDTEVTGTVITFVVKNTGRSTFAESDWRTPNLSYGSAGTQAEKAISSVSDGDADASIGQGVGGPVPVGASRTVREGFAVAKQDLTQATLSVGDTMWSGDFTTVGATSPTSVRPSTITTEAVPTTTEQVPTQTAECSDGQARDDGGGTYSTCVGGMWEHVEPTFDPDSGDGYGSNQPLPPLCVRFPDQYDC